MQDFPTPVSVSVPVNVSVDLLRELRLHPSTSYEDKEEMDKLIGWFVCAYDLMVEHAKKRPG